MKKTYPKIDNLNGTKFQKKVWLELSKIPKGETRTYKEIAIAIGHPLAVRAVANACGKNPNPIKIPCHRVIRSDGKLGGYSCLLYTSPSPRDLSTSRMPSSA